jgi:hypothetical protein
MYTSAMVENAPGITAAILCERGEMMRRVCLMMLIASLSVSLALARQKWSVDSTNLKMRQKEELRALKMKQKYARSSLEDSNLPKAVRIQLMHELKREQRKLRQRQKDERQALKDRERLLKLEMEQFEKE